MVDCSRKSTHKTVKFVKREKFPRISKYFPEKKKTEQKEQKNKRKARHV